jgi:NAD(P)-dependent dehydrogenase (short-subunit alcohol dehydrogenase family)
MISVCVTGHTSELGSAIFDAVKDRGFSVAGASRRDGFDLDIEDTYHAVFDCHYDYVINNAYSGIGQSNLLMWLWQWFPETHIINIGSVNADRTDASKQSQIEYSANKAHLRNVHNHIVRCGYSKSTLVELGMCDTLYNNSKSGPKLTQEAVGAFIANIITFHTNITTVRFEP